jgi:PKD repeat protein
VISEGPLCEKIVLPPMRGFRVGTKINGTGDATFHITLDAEGIGGTCRITTSNGGAKSCDIELDETLGDYIEADVCLFADESNTNLYNVNFEDVDVCGYNEDNGQIFHHDFEIYARPLKYKEVEDFRFDSNIFEVETNLSGIVWDYVDDKYGGDCDPECIIPIKVYSGILQSLRIDDSKLGYKANGLEQNPIVDFYSLDEISASISSEFMKLVIDDAEFSVPNEVGKHDLDFRIGGAGIDDEINVKSVPTIVRVFPTRPALLVPTKFVAVMEGLVENESYQYIWDFGDGSSSKISLDNVMEYTYSAKDSYTITLNVTSDFGEVSRSFPISVVTPYDAINKTINEYTRDLDKVDGKLKLLPSWVQERILKINDIDSLRGAVDRLEKKYKETLRDEDEELIKIMNDLVVLKIPNDLRVGQSINKAAFVQSRERFDVNALGELGAGDVQEDEEKYYDSVNAWVRQNVDITLESSTYFLYYESGSSEVLVSHIKLVMTPMKDVEEFFMILEGNPSDIVLMDDYREKDLDFGYGLRFPELFSGESKNVEFLIPEVVEILDPPVYVSPEYRSLEFSFEAGVCNNNNICDANAGETYKNCRADCKPWSLTLVFLFVLVVVTLIIYVVLQEWYKRGYERHLFKNKNQLFNIMAFMRNAQNAGMGKKQVFEKLRPFKWSKEQLNYAWNRLHGKRTGMWEIPIFRSFERKKIKEEMARRGVVGRIASGKVVSRPVGVGDGTVKKKKKGFFKGLFRKKKKE